MARSRKVNTTKNEIIQVATKMFLEKGYSNTSIKAIGDELGISSGHVMFYFPTKEHLLEVLVQMMCEYQWQILRENADGGKASLLGVCLELVVMCVIGEENEHLRDLYIAAYTNPLPLAYIRRNDAERAKMVYQEYCTDWSEEQFAEAEILSSGIEYAMYTAEPGQVSMEVRIRGALNSIMMIYNVPLNVRTDIIEQVLAMDYYKIGRDICDGFVEYVETVNEQKIEEMLAE